jgi:hypothetical protein
VVQALWERLWIDELLIEQVARRRLGFSVERAWFAVVANHVCAPASKLYRYEQWLPQHAHMAGTEFVEVNLMLTSSARAAHWNKSPLLSV